MKNNLILFAITFFIIVVFFVNPNISSSQQMFVLGEQVTNFRVWGQWSNRARNVRRAARAINNFTLSPLGTAPY